MAINDTIVKGDPSLGFAVYLTPGWLLALNPLRLPDRDPQRNQVDADEPSTCLSSPNRSPYSCSNDID